MLTGAFWATLMRFCRSEVIRVERLPMWCVNLSCKAVRYNVDAERHLPQVSMAQARNLDASMTFTNDNRVVVLRGIVADEVESASSLLLKLEWRMLSTLLDNSDQGLTP